MVRLAVGSESTSLTAAARACARCFFLRLRGTALWFSAIYVRVRFA